MNKTLHLLQVEDSEPDAALIQRHLRKAGYELEAVRVETAEAMRSALEAKTWDVILCDYSLPKFDALSALGLMRQMQFDIPFIIISGTIGEDAAVEAMRTGAHDYLMKDGLSRLLPAIERERKEAENRRARRAGEAQLALQSAALDAAANAIIITDRSGKILWVNPAFSNTSGYSLQEAVGQTPGIVNSGKQPREFYDEMWSTILAGKVWRNSLVNKRKDGELKDEDLTITPITDGTGTITHFIGIKQDITEVKRAEAALKAKNEELSTMTQQLWQASKLATMGELAASIAHELNNPLATVALRAENLLMQMPADSENCRPLEIIAQEVDRMASLVNNLLQFSRRSHRQISTVEPAGEITNSIEFVHYHLRNRNIKVLLEFTGSIPTVQADRQQLRQLFLNLLTNAADAMPGGGEIKIRILPTSLQHQEAVEIEFADSGDGIKQEYLDKIWDPFFTTKAEGKGTGLGLAICRRIVEEHGGTIAITSEHGRGAQVRIVLPATNPGVPVETIETQ